jgi:hypothetical protein
MAERPWMHDNQWLPNVRTTFLQTFDGRVTTFVPRGLRLEDMKTTCHPSREFSQAAGELMNAALARRNNEASLAGR